MRFSSFALLFFSGCLCLCAFCYFSIKIQLNTNGKWLWLIATDNEKCENSLQRGAKKTDKLFDERATICGERRKIVFSFFLLSTLSFFMQWNENADGNHVIFHLSLSTQSSWFTVQLINWLLRLFPVTFCQSS